MNILCESLPLQLPPMERRGDTPLTYERVKEAMAEEGDGLAIFPVVGDCLEAAGVEDGGWVAVDFRRFPAPPVHKPGGGTARRDLCLCFARFPSQPEPTVMCKTYDGVWGPWQQVGTAYDLTTGRHRMNCGMRALEIFGVIFAAWGRDGALKWERDREEFPEKLGTGPTIHGVNIGDPVAVTGYGA